MRLYRCTVPLPLFLVLLNLADANPLTAEQSSPLSVNDQICNQTYADLGHHNYAQPMPTLSTNSDSKTNNLETQYSILLSLDDMSNTTAVATDSSPDKGNSKATHSPPMIEKTKKTGVWHDLKGWMFLLVGMGTWVLLDVSVEKIGGGDPSISLLSEGICFLPVLNGWDLLRDY